MVLTCYATCKQHRRRSARASANIPIDALLKIHTDAIPKISRPQLASVNGQAGLNLTQS